MNRFEEGRSVRVVHIDDLANLSHLVGQEGTVTTSLTTISCVALEKDGPMWFNNDDLAYVPRTHKRVLDPPEHTRTTDDGRGYLGYHNDEHGLGFVWSGKADDPIEVEDTAGDGSLAYVFMTAAPPNPARFKAECEDWLALCRTGYFDEVEFKVTEVA